MAVEKANHNVYDDTITEMKACADAVLNICDEINAIANDVAVKEQEELLPLHGIRDIVKQDMFEMLSQFALLDGSIGDADVLYLESVFGKNVAKRVEKYLVDYKQTNKNYLDEIPESVRFFAKLDAILSITENSSKMQVRLVENYGKLLFGLAAVNERDADHLLDAEEEFVAIYVKRLLSYSVD